MLISTISSTMRKKIPSHLHSYTHIHTHSLYISEKISTMSQWTENLAYKCIYICVKKEKKWCFLESDSQCTGETFSVPFCSFAHTFVLSFVRWFVGSFVFILWVRVNAREFSKETQKKNNRNKRCVKICSVAVVRTKAHTHINCVFNFVVCIET